MKKQADPFISISDLMAGVITVVLLLFIMAALTAKMEAAKREKEKIEAQEKEKERNKNVVHDIMRDIKETIAQFDGIKVIVDEQKIVLQSSLEGKTDSFKKGDHKPSPPAYDRLKQIGWILSSKLKEHENLQVKIVGYADGSPVKNRLPCGADDNFTLSAYRAREARNALLSELGEKRKCYENYIVIEAYGSTNLLDSHNQNNEIDRRVEILINTIKEGEKRTNKESIKECLKKFNQDKS